MISSILWPTDLGIEIDKIGIEEDCLSIVAHGTQTMGRCPKCGAVSHRMNGHYRRHPADLPCSGYSIEFDLTVPRFFCDNDACKQRTFSEVFPSFVSRYARRTERLIEQQRRVGFAVSAEQAARLLPTLGMETSPDTLIRLVRNTPESAHETPRVLGVDDWAKRKGQSYGTILVDLERRQVVDLLDERSADSLARWLQEHPGVEIISRDRGTEYIEGATRGAPEATQIADRFHLLQNLIDTLKRMFGASPSNLRDAACKVAEEMQTDEQPETDTELLAKKVNSEHTDNEEDSSEKPTLRELRFAEVKELQAQGWSRRAIARRLQIDPRTVAKYFTFDSCPRRVPAAQSTSKALPYLGYLTRRWTEGCNDISQLHRELQKLGFDGHYSGVYRVVKQQLQDRELTPSIVNIPVSIPRLSVTEAAWLLVHPDDRLSDIQLRLREKLCEMTTEFNAARKLAQTFFDMVCERKSDLFEGWLAQAETSGIKAFKNFVVSLRRDYAAISAALTFCWSNGQVEGQVNRLKFIKRRMYGRANFDLLRRHVLGLPAAD